MYGKSKKMKAAMLQKYGKKTGAKAQPAPVSEGTEKKKGY